MDWKSIRFDWNHTRSFLVTAEEGSLSAAARALDANQPTIGRQVSALERELGVTLFERAGRGLELTQAGLSLLEHAKTMGEAANQVSLTASGQAESLEGSICITATEAMAAFKLPAVIQKLRLQEPGIEIEIIASNSTSDLKRREADIAIRAYRPTQSDLIAKKVGDLPLRLYATEQYLESLCGLEGDVDLTKAQFIGFDRSNRFIDGLNERGLKLTPDNFSVFTENHLVHWEMVKKGLGIGIMSEDIGDQEPLVIRAIEDFEPILIETWLVAHRELRTSRRMRTVFEFLSEELL